MTCRQKDNHDTGTGSPPSRYGICAPYRWTQLKNTPHPEEGGTLQWGHLTTSTWARWSRSASTVMSHVGSWHMVLMGWDEISPPWPSSPNPITPVLPLMRKNIKSTTVLFKSVKVIKDKGSLRNCHGPVEARDTSWIHEILHPGWYSGIEKAHWVKTSEIKLNSGV